MLPTKLFTMRLNTHEKAMLAELAKELRRPNQKFIITLYKPTNLELIVHLSVK